MKNRSRDREKEIRQLLSEQERSGESVKAFAERRGVSPWNSGFYFHVGDRASPVQTGIEVQIYDTPGDETKLTDHDSGGFIPGGAPAKNAARPAGEWNHMHVSCEDGTVRVTLNGTLVNRIRLDHERLASRPGTGAIGFQDHSKPMALRNVRVRGI